MSHEGIVFLCSLTAAAILRGEIQEDNDYIGGTGEQYWTRHLVGGHPLEDADIPLC
jgi:hypothetical protein